MKRGFGYRGGVTVSGSLRERKKNQTRAEIFAAAVELFRTRGYEQTTIDQIVEAANYSRATFHRHFGSKEDVLFGDADQRLADLKAALAQLRGAPAPWQAVREAVIEQVTAFATSDPEIRQTCMQLFYSIPAYNRRLAVNMAWEDAVAEFLAAERGTDADTDTHSRVIAAMIAGAVRAAMQAEHAGAAHLEVAIRDAFDTLERGLSPAATSGRAWLVDARNCDSTTTSIEERKST